MRTKTLVIMAAALAAGIASVSAQVYSQNVVGYVNLTLQPGLNLVTDQMMTSNYNASTGMNVNDALGVASPVIPANSLLYLWKSDNSGFANAQIAGGDGVWYDPNTGNASTANIKLGQSFFIYLGDPSVPTPKPPPSVMTLVGDVPQGTNSLAVPGAGLSVLIADIPPVSQDIATNGFPIMDNMLLYTFPAGGKTYNNALIGGAGTPYGAWYDPNTGNPVVVAPAVGQGFVVKADALNAAGTWVRSFVVPQ